MLLVLLLPRHMHTKTRIKYKPDSSALHQAVRHVPLHFIPYVSFEVGCDSRKRCAFSNTPLDVLKSGAMEWKSSPFPLDWSSLAVQGRVLLSLVSYFMTCKC